MPSLVLLFSTSSEMENKSLSQRDNGSAIEVGVTAGKSGAGRPLNPRRRWLPRSARGTATVMLKGIAAGEEIQLTPANGRISILRD